MDVGGPLFWIPLGIVLAIFCIACLRVIGHEYYMAVCWHNLKVEVHRLRIEQHERIQQLGGAEAAPAAAPVPDDAATDAIPAPAADDAASERAAA